MVFKRYYFRVIGFALGGAGLGLIADELIQKKLKWQLIGHETLGAVMFIAGLFCISRKPGGKDGQSNGEGTL